MEILSHSISDASDDDYDEGLPKFFGDWRVIEDREFLSPISASIRSEFKFISHAESGNNASKNTELELPVNFQSQTKDGVPGKVSDEAANLNNEAAEKLKRIKEKLAEIESSLDTVDMKKYLDENYDSDKDSYIYFPQLSQIDKKLAKAIRGVLEMKKDAEAAIAELASSTANFDVLLDDTGALRQDADSFRVIAALEKANSSKSLKVQIFVCGLVLLLSKMFLEKLI